MAFNSLAYCCRFSFYCVLSPSLFILDSNARAVPRACEKRTFSIRKHPWASILTTVLQLQRQFCSPYDASGRAKYGFLNGSQGEIFVMLSFPDYEFVSTREQPPSFSLSLSLLESYITCDSTLCNVNYGNELDVVGCRGTWPLNRRRYPSAWRNHTSPQILQIFR